MSEEHKVQLIKLADGTLIDPETRMPLEQFQPKRTAREEEPDEDNDDEVDAHGELELRPLARRSIMDLALTPQQMAVVNNVLVYSCWGLPDDEIATQCGISIHQVHIVRDLDDYKKMHSALVAGLRDAYSGTVHGIFAEAAPQAARRVVSAMKSKSKDIALSAQKDVLDRAGFRPIDRVEHNHKINGGDELVIRIIKQTDVDKLPIIEGNLGST